MSVRASYTLFGSCFNLKIGFDFCSSFSLILIQTGQFFIFFLNVENNVALVCVCVFSPVMIMVFQVIDYHNFLFIKIN